MDANEIHRFIEDVKKGPGWYQTFDFGDGLIAKGKYNTIDEIGRYRFPLDMRGKTYLEIGCNIGMMCYEMYRRGATKVVGVDISEEYVALAKKAASLVGADIEYYVFNVDKESIVERFGTFDVTGMFSVIHLSPPIHPQIFNPHWVLANVYKATNSLFLTEISSRLQPKYFSKKLWIFRLSKKMFAKRFLRTCKWSKVQYIGEGKKDRFVFHCYK